VLPSIKYFADRLKRLPTQLDPLPAQASLPLPHLMLGLDEAWGLHEYVRGNVERKGRHKAVAERNQRRLRTLVFISMVEAFERFIKELAAVCVDALASKVVDDRLKTLSIDARSLAAHFEAGSLGRALTEGSTWLETDQINGRFRKLLAEPREEGKFYLFPRKKEPDVWRGDTLDLVFQLRHAVVHNAGVVTAFDAQKLAALIAASVPAGGRLTLERGDLWYLVSVLRDTGGWANERVADEVAKVMTTIHQSAPTSFDAAAVATELAAKFGRRITISGVTRPLAPNVESLPTGG
jgi:hypothetical protein